LWLPDKEEKKKMKYTLNGLIYRGFIDPVLSSYYGKVTGEINPGDNVLDIASGTGSLALSISQIAGKVTGIDLSEEMVGIANRIAGKRDKENIEFMLQDASDLSLFEKNEFNVAVTSMAIHQFDPFLAERILKEMKRIARKVIIMDYNHPILKIIPRVVILAIERIAGGDHYRNFRNYNSEGGLDYFIKKAGLTIRKEKLRKGATFRVVVCE